MRVAMLNPPKDDKEFATRCVELMKAAQALNIYLEPKGFALAFQQENMRVFTAHDDNNAVVGLAMMVSGTKFFSQEVTSTVLFAGGPARAELLAHMRDTCRILRATHMIYEAEEGDTIGGELSNVRMLEVR